MTLGILVFLCEVSRVGVTDLDCREMSPHASRRMRGTHHIHPLQLDLHDLMFPSPSQTLSPVL